MIRPLRDRTGLRGRRRGGRCRRRAHWWTGRALGPLLRRQLRDGRRRLTANVSHLVLYEPSLGLPYPPGSIERIEAAFAEGDHDAAIAVVLVDILEMTEDEIDGYRASPLWPVRLAAAPRSPVSAGRSRTGCTAPGQFDTITAATLLLTGSDSVPS